MDLKVQCPHRRIDSFTYVTYSMERLPRATLADEVGLRVGLAVRRHYGGSSSFPVHQFFDALAIGISHPIVALFTV